MMRMSTAREVGNMTAATLKSAMGQLYIGQLTTEGWKLPSYLLERGQVC